MISEVYGKNLFSWPLLKYPITKGISQISGMNHDDGNYEGSGKSSVANIWCWTWYGKIPKEAKIDECVMDGEKNAVGETTLLTGGKIIRRRGKNQGLFIASPSGKESKASQDEVDQLVGMSFQVFCQAVYSAQNYEKRFINADEETRAKILTEIRGIKVYDKARKVAEVAEREAKSELEVERVTLRDLGERVTETKKEIKWIAQQVTEFEAEKIKKIREINEQLKDTKSKAIIVDETPYLEQYEESEHDLAVMEKEMEELKAVEQKASFVRLANHNIQKDLEDLATRFKSVKDGLEKASLEECPTCGQDIDDPRKFNEWVESQKNLLKELQLEIDNKTNSIEEVEEVDGIEELRNKITKQRQIKNDFNSKLQTRRVLNSQAEAFKQQITKLKEQRSNAKSSGPTELERKSSEYQKKLEKLEEKYATQSNTVKELERTVKSNGDLKKEFRRIKSDIFETALKELSRDSNRFLQEMFETPVKITFKTTVSRGVPKIGVTVRIKGKERSLGLYSGGQFRRISIAVDLALSEMVAKRSTKKLGIRVLDEPMKDLSPQSKQRVINLLKKLSGSTILIEHDQEIQSVVDNNFKIEFRNGRSKVA